MFLESKGQTKNINKNSLADLQKIFQFIYFLFYIYWRTFRKYSRKSTYVMLKGPSKMFPKNPLEDIERIFLKIHWYSQNTVASLLTSKVVQKYSWINHVWWVLRTFFFFRCHVSCGLLGKYSNISTSNESELLSKNIFWIIHVCLLKGPIR